MANEFKHKDPCATLTQSEYIGADGTGHVFDCQATGDILYADSATVLKNLARGSTSQVLQIVSCKPAWTSTPTIGSTSWSNAGHAHAATNSGGTLNTSAIGAGTLGVARGGTGASCLTDGGILLGSGTSAVTAMAVLADGEMIVGDGSTDPVAESGATLRTSIGVGTGDSPQFTDLTLTGGCITITGAATDVDLIDNNACAISFDASGQAGILAIDTQNCAEGVKMSGKLTVTGAISTTGAVTVGACDTGLDVKFFGASAGAYLIYDQAQDQLEIRGAAADATTSTGKLLLTTALTDINANDVIGSINFQAPLEAGGTDAVAVAAGIRAVAGATFTCAVNNTDLIFYTGKSEAATEKFRFTADGEIGIGGTNYGTDGQVLTSGGPCNPAAWEDAAGGPTEATEAIMENQGASVTNRYVSPEVTKHHPGVAKAHVLFEQDGTHGVTGTSYNVSSVCDGDACPGNTDIVWDVDFANTTYTTVGMTEVDKVLMVQDATIATTGITIRVKGRESNNNEDAGEVMIVAFGTQ